MVPRLAIGASKLLQFESSASLLLPPRRGGQGPARQHQQRRQAGALRPVQAGESCVPHTVIRVPLWPVAEQPGLLLVHEATLR